MSEAKSSPPRWRLPARLLGLTLATMAASCIPGGPPDCPQAGLREPLKELGSGELPALLAHVAYSPQVCAGEPVEVKVEAAAADEAVDIYVQGRPGTHQWLQLFGTAGPRQVQVYAHTASGKSEFVELPIEVVDCEATWPRLQVALDAEHDRMVDFVVANAQELGEGLSYHWTFGDGAEVDTDVPAVRHTYAIDAIDWHSPDTAFQASVEAVGVCPQAVARHSVVLRPLHAFNEARGLIQLPVEYDITAHTGDYVIHNVEDQAVTLNREVMDLQPCDRSQSVSHEPGTDPAIVIEAGATYAGHLPLDWFGEDVCGVELHLEGTLKGSDARVEVPIYLEVRDNPSREHPVEDPAVQHMLDQARAAGLFHGDRINVGDLQEYAREGRIDFARPTPLLESDLPPLGGVVAIDHHFVCHPNNEHETPSREVTDLLGPDVECRPSGDYVTSDAYVANGHSGNIALSAGCGMVGALLRAVTPRQRFSHTGVFTDDLDTLRNSTASEDWLEAHHDSSGLLPENLRYARPGILDETIDQVYYGMTWMDDMDPAGRSYEMRSFNPDPARCDGDVGLTRPTLISPLLPADDTDAERIRVDHEAALTREVAFVVDGMEGHYRFFGYSDGSVGLDLSKDWGAGPHGEDERNHATVCSSTIWTAAKSLRGWPSAPARWENLILEGELEPADLAYADGPVDLGTERPIDGLYFYTQEERLAAAALLRGRIANKLPYPNPIAKLLANQIVNCFASDECNQTDQGEAWRHTEGANAVSPDDLLLWDAPWGHNEPLALRPAQNRQIYTWQRKEGEGDLLVKVVNPDTNPVVGADVYVAGRYGRTDDEGKVRFLGVPAGTEEVSAMTWTGDTPSVHLLTGSTTVSVAAFGLTSATIVLGERQPGPNEINEPQEMIVDYAISATDDEWIVSNEHGDTSDTFVVRLARGAHSQQHVTHELEPFCVGDEVVVKVEFVFDLLTDNQVETIARVKLYEGTGCDTNDLEDHEEQEQTLGLDEAGHLVFDLENSGVGGGDTAHVDIALLNQLTP